MYKLNRLGFTNTVTLLFLKELFNKKTNKIKFLQFILSLLFFFDKFLFSMLDLVKKSGLKLVTYLKDISRLFFFINKFYIFLHKSVFIKIL